MISTHTKLSGKSKHLFFSQLHSLISSGLSFSKSFTLIVGNAVRSEEKLYTALFKDVVKGNGLWKAMQCSNAFSELDYNVVKIGEESGKLPDALAFLSDYYQKREGLKRLCVNAFSYPVITMCVAVAVLVFMLMAVVPMFEQVYTRMGGELPTVTKYIMIASRKAPVIFATFCIIIITLAGLRAFCGQSPAYKKYTSGILMRIPGINSIIRQYQVSRFCRIMFLLISSDVPLLDALRLTEGVVSFYPYRISVGSICLHIESGGVFSDGIGRYEYLYGKRLTALMKVGEETGTIDRMLYSFGEETEKSLQHLIRQLNNILEPVLILGIGIIVAFVLIAMYMPMFRLGLTIQ